VVVLQAIIALVEVIVMLAMVKVDLQVLVKVN
jgi:hypothetical protein